VAGEKVKPTYYPHSTRAMFSYLQ